MTEETIIDGIDVSGCKYFQIEANTIYPKSHYCGSTFNRFCEDDENCVYKQLKRLEAENANLKEKLEKIKEKCKFFISECKECKECENPDIIIDCIDCTTGGKAVASYKILNIVEDIEGAKDE